MRHQAVQIPVPLGVTGTDSRKAMIGNSLRRPRIQPFHLGYAGWQSQVFSGRFFKIFCDGCGASSRPAVSSGGAVSVWPLASWGCSGFSPQMPGCSPGCRPWAGSPYGRIPPRSGPQPGPRGPGTGSRRSGLRSAVCSWWPSLRESSAGGSPPPPPRRRWRESPSARVGYHLGTTRARPRRLFTSQTMSSLGR